MALQAANQDQVAAGGLQNFTSQAATHQDQVAAGGLQNSAAPWHLGWITMSKEQRKDIYV
eukprot:scaffold65425_cov34-Prasinocladus_malaysianus.AAC.1